MNTEISPRVTMLERRAALLARLEAIRADIGRGLNPNSSERAIELENADVLYEIARVAQEELDQVEENLLQIDSDS
jgi:hypothetical protein